MVHHDEQKGYAEMQDFLRQGISRLSDAVMDFANNWLEERGLEVVVHDEDELSQITLGGTESGHGWIDMKIYVKCKKPKDIDRNMPNVVRDTPNCFFEG